MQAAIRQIPRYKWWVFGSVAIGIFMSVVDHGSVLIALPNIEGHFGANLSSVQWVVIGYSLAISICLLPSARLGDILGPSRPGGGQAAGRATSRKIRQAST